MCKQSSSNWSDWFNMHNISCSPNILDSSWSMQCSDNKIFHVSVTKLVKWLHVPALLLCCPAEQRSVHFPTITPEKSKETIQTHLPNKLCTTDILNIWHFKTGTFSSYRLILLKMSSQLNMTRVLCVWLCGCVKENRCNAFNGLMAFSQVKEK